RPLAVQGFETRYGLGSLKSHLDQAAELGFDVVSHETSGSSLDIDEPEDLKSLALHLAPGLAPHTRAYLAQSGITRRLAGSRPWPSNQSARRPTLHSRKPRRWPSLNFLSP